MSATEEDWIFGLQRNTFRLCVYVPVSVKVWDLIKNLFFQIKQILFSENHFFVFSDAEISSLVKVV